jgi:hypothetical protein
MWETYETQNVRGHTNITSFVTTKKFSQQSNKKFAKLEAFSLSWVPGCAGIRSNEIADRLARGGSALKFYVSEPALGFCKQVIQKRISSWLHNQYWARWRVLGDTQRQARELNSGPILGARSRFLSFNMTQVRAVTGLLTGHSNLRRHLHLLGLVDNPMHTRCGMGEETSAHILCECEALVSSRFAHLGSSFL